MGAARNYAVIDPATGKIDRRIFSDAAVYDDEMEKIFGRAWLMIGHESLLPAADDFFQTYMGEDPVILTRDGQGRLHALLNMCRHRGNRVCRVDDGNAKRFMCTYHGWTYLNDGALDHVPGETEAYYGVLDRSSLGLLEARVETYAGIVFATWAKDAPSLEAYLGDARWYFDTVFNRRDGGMQALGPMKWLEPVNWKTLVDNCSDNYHVPTSHLASAVVQTRWLGRPRLSHEDQFASPNRHAFVNGHGVTFRDADDNVPRYVHGMSSDTMRLFQEYHDGTSGQAQEPNPQPNTVENPSAPTPVDPTTTAETPSSDLSGSTNDRATGSSDASNPFNISNDLDQGSPYHLIPEFQEGNPYHLIDSNGLTALSDIGDLRTDATVFYNPESAAFVSLFGADKPSDLIPDVDTFKYGLVGGVIFAVTTDIGLAVIGLPGEIPTSQPEAFELGFEFGSGAHETIDQILQRGSALESLSQGMWADSNSPEPTPTPGPTPAAEPGSLPDMTPLQRLK